MENSSLYFLNEETQRKSSHYIDAYTTRVFIKTNVLFSLFSLVILDVHIKTNMLSVAVGKELEHNYSEYRAVCKTNVTKLNKLGKT